MKFKHRRVLPLLAFCVSVLLTSAATAATRPPWTSNHVVGSPNPPAPYTVERVFPQITFEHPVDFAVLPGTAKLAVADQSGRLWTFDARGDATKPELVLDFRKLHQPFDSILGFTFHPGFATNRYVFINYNEPGGREDGAFVSRFTFSSLNPPTIDPASEKVFLRWLSGGHNGCTLAFGNDGFLYVSTGDTADPDPPDGKRSTGQDLSDLLASVLRIDVDHAAGTNAYAIPRDNPFVATPGARPEVWAFGFRNPFRMSIDHATGELWVGDVGWEQWEMIHRVQRGGNYGWPLVEGPNTHVRTDVKPGPGPIRPPLVALPHSEAASITGGRVYHGAKLAALRDAYLYGDWETGKFWALRHDGDKLLSNDELCDTTLKPVCFAEDRNGELLILDYNGGLYVLTPNVAPPANLAFPRRLAQTGIFTDLAKLTPAPGVLPYRINAGMWSDYASVDRVVGVPGDGAMATADGRETITGKMWFYPSNTVFARTLTLEMKRGEPASQRRIETQLLHFDGQAWNAYTYRWNAAQTDADLVASEGASDSFMVSDTSAPGGRREIPWRFVSRSECMRCHNLWAADVISFNRLQLNTPGPVSELQRLEQLGVLRLLPAPPAQSPDPTYQPPARLADPGDASAPVADRARSWLHANCAGCHRFGAGGGIAAQFNFDQPLTLSRTVDVVPTRGDFGIVGARIIAPGDPFRSTLFYRLNTEGAGHMPHIGSRLTDEAGVRLVRDWIRSLPVTQPSAQENVAAQKLATEIAAALKTHDHAKLLATMNGALALLDQLSADPASPASPAAIAAATSHPNAQVRELFQRLLPADQRRPTLGANFAAASVLGLAGDAARGKELFLGAAQCSRCHVCDGAGRAFGPELTGVARKYPAAQLLEQIVAPSKIIAPEFKTTTVTLRDDTEFSGFIRSSSATELVLRDETLGEHRIKLADVKDRRESALSAMPEGLLASLTAQEAADLLAYLIKGDPAR